MKESNKKMAKFLGWEYHNSQDISKLPKWIDETGKKMCTNHEQLKFHEDWNWLMKVVEKIEEDDYRVEIYNTDCEISYWNNEESQRYLLHTNYEETKIKACYLTCLEFIEQYDIKD